MAVHPVRRVCWEAFPAEYGHDLTGLDFYPWQVAMLEGQHRKWLGNCARQSGKTECATIKVAHRMTFRARTLILCVTNGLDLSQEFVRRTAHVLEASELWPPRERWPLANTKDIVLPNASRLRVVPATERVRGWSRAHFVLVDEAAQIPDFAYHALTPTQAANAATAEFWAISTPFGRRGWWHWEFTKGGPEWQRVTQSAAECPHIDQTFLIAERARMGDLLFRQEYGCEFIDADGATVFPAAMLDRAFAPVDDATEAAAAVAAFGGATPSFGIGLGPQPIFFGQPPRREPA